jgi:hypothetical protein
MMAVIVTLLLWVEQRGVAHPGSKVAVVTSLGASTPTRDHVSKQRVSTKVIANATMSDYMAPLLKQTL